MSYDVMFFALAAGADPDDALARLLDDAPPRDVALEAELARALTEAEPSLEPVRDERGVVQLDGPEMQAFLEAIAAALDAWRGWVAFDPQLGRRLELPADAAGAGAPPPVAAVAPRSLTRRSDAPSPVHGVGVDAAIFGHVALVPGARSADPGGVSISVLGAPRPASMPLIAVTTSEMRHNPFDLATPQADPPRREMALGMTYLQAIGGAGALAIVVPPMPGPAIPALLDRVDGICLSGGPDIHPDAYGAAPHAELGPTEPPLDAFELALARAADERDMPILAICRGAQLFNVARGGTLHQHLPDVVGDVVTHRQPGAPGAPIHDVTVAAGSRLAAILGRRRAAVNSFHHQAVDVLGERLAITARADDGTVEAFEATDRGFVVGVQWHAECLVDRDEQAALFAAFVDACGDRAAEAGTVPSAAESA